MSRWMTARKKNIKNLSKLQKAKSESVQSTANQLTETSFFCLVGNISFHPFTFKIVQAIFEDFIKIKNNERYYLHRP